MRTRNVFFAAVTLSIGLLLAGCGGSSTTPTPTPTPTPSTQTTETVLYNFGAPNSGDASNPSTDLVIDSTGNLYGTTASGGTHNTGTVFKVTPSGTETILHSFGPIGTLSDGSHPLSLVMDGSGNLYGTTQSGGSNSSGTVFKITPSGTETILYSFSNVTPVGHIAIDSSGNLYGAIISGSANLNGSFYKISTSGTETILAGFSLAPGAGFDEPVTGVVMDGSGNLYGEVNASSAAGYGSCGGGQGDAIIKVTPSGSMSWLCTGTLFSEFMIDSTGNLYATSANTNSGIYKITPSLAAYSLYSFSGDKNSSSTINHSDLVMDGSGNLYGTTSNDGANGVGSVFKLTPSGAESIVYSFKNSGDGGFPMGGLVIDSSGNLYGTTSLGGTNGGGIVFKITNP